LFGTFTYNLRSLTGHMSVHVPTMNEVGEELMSLVQHAATDIMIQLLDSYYHKSLTVFMCMGFSFKASLFESVTHFCNESPFLI
jgi:hypothetical protein